MGVSEPLVPSYDRIERDDPSLRIMQPDAIYHCDYITADVQSGAQTVLTKFASISTANVQFVSLKKKKNQKEEMYSDYNHASRREVNLNTILK